MSVVQLARRATAVRRSDPEDLGDTQRWVVSYADFITLLFAFFVVMYSISSVNDGKFRELSDSMVSVFQAPPSRPAAIDLGGGLQGVGTQDNPASEAQPATRAFEQAIQDDFPVPSVAASQADVSAGDIEQALVEPIELEQVRVRQSEHWLEVELDAEFAFASGAAHLAAGALPALEKIAELLTRSRTPIRVEGFTDDVAVNGGPFASNWALSAARAGSVAAALQNFGVDAQRLAATGFGSLQPRADNASEAGRRSNRRVVIALAKRPDVAAASVSAPAAEGPEYVPLEQLERVNVLPGAAEIEL